MSEAMTVGISKYDVEQAGQCLEELLEVGLALGELNGERGRGAVVPEDAKAYLVALRKISAELLERRDDVQGAIYRIEEKLAWPDSRA